MVATVTESPTPITAETSILIENLKRVRIAAAEVGAAKGDMVFCDHCTWESWDGIHLEWRVQMIMPKLKSHIYAGNGETFEAALSECVKAIRADQNVCKVCGGRMDGACRHSH